MRIAWMTDIHLEFADDTAFADLVIEVNTADAEAVIISGDISNGRRLAVDLGRLDEALKRPIYFVLGNHDYYHTDIESGRRACKEVTAGRPKLHWLETEAALQLSEKSVVLGHGGWGDARIGSPLETPVLLNDFLMIRDLAGISRQALVARLRQLGDEAAAHLRCAIEAVPKITENVLVVTHVPPWREACWHDGRHSNDDWAPWFTCKAIGDVLVEAAQANPNRRFTVVCGHTHGAGETEIRPNLHVSTAGAEYGKPRVDRVLEIG